MQEMLLTIGRERVKITLINQQSQELGDATFQRKNRVRSAQHPLPGAATGRLAGAES
jgi:hypothetical protein